MPKPRNNWWVMRRHERAGAQHIQTKRVKTYAEAIGVVKLWYRRHGIGYGIQVKFMIEEIGELAPVRDFYLINRESEIK